jgi:hypothetical protein
LYFLDTGLAAKNLKDVAQSGHVLLGASDGRPLKTLVSLQHAPDGLGISISAGKLFWTCMGVTGADDGAVYSANLDGTEVTPLVAGGQINTGKQLIIDSVQSKLYFCDREGLRVWRCNFDGSDLELLVQTGDRKNEAEKLDQTRWCVRIAVSHTTGKFYWTQKGPSKGSKGRIFRANIDFPQAQNALQRNDIECIFQNLPEPIDLDIDETHQALYWTDRGELPLGNSVNKASLKGLRPMSGPSIAGKDYEIVARNFHEAVGIKLDLIHHHFYPTDLGGAVYRFNLDGSGRGKFYEDQGSFTGITLAHV